MLARLLRRIADRLDPPPYTPPVWSVPFVGDALPDTAIVDEVELWTAGDVVRIPRAEHIHFAGFPPFSPVGITRQPNKPGSEPE